MSNNNQIVWLVEDNTLDAHRYKQLLERSQKLHVEPIQPEPSLEDYAYLVSSPQTGAFLIDYRLGDEADVPYDGIDLADFLRTLRSELPIFILTTYPNDAEDDESLAVDGIIDKKNLSAHTESYVARILRIMHRYEDAMSEKTLRLKQLIDNKLSRSLTEEEERDLMALRADFERPSDLALAERGSRIEAHLQRQEERLDELQALFKSILDEIQKDK